MSDKLQIKEYCLNTYSRIYSETFSNLKAKHEGRGALTEARIHEIETEAQKAAIKASIIEGLRTYPDELPSVWHSIYEAHVYRKSGISDYAVIQNVVSADQSWKKSSGHAFEEMIKELATWALHDLNVEFVLQRDLNTLIKAGEISNEPRDISWLKEQVKGNIFDLYALTTVKNRKYCFGCIQCKTSIRDRVTRDREPSIHAMESYFWSIVFVLDGSYLRNPKFQYMVNGGSAEFPENGWHAMYDMSREYNVDRIYPLDLDFKLLRQHAKKAVEDWLNRRQWFNKDWRAE